MRRAMGLSLFAGLGLVALATAAQGQSTPRPSLEDLQQQLDDLRQKTCVQSEANGDSIRPLFCNPVCAQLGDLFTVFQPTCFEVPLSSDEACGQGEFVSRSSDSGGVTAVVESARRSSTG